MSKRKARVRNPASFEARFADNPTGHVWVIAMLAEDDGWVLGPFLTKRAAEVWKCEEIDAESGDNYHVEDYDLYVVPMSVPKDCEKLWKLGWESATS